MHVMCYVTVAIALQQCVLLGYIHYNRGEAPQRNRTESNACLVK